MCCHAGVFHFSYCCIKLRVTVLLFSSYAEAFGAASLDLELMAGARVSDLLSRIREMAGPQELPKALVAVNQVYATSSQSLNVGDEIAIIPPVAGG